MKDLIKCNTVEMSEVSYEFNERSEPWNKKKMNAIPLYFLE